MLVDEFEEEQGSVDQRCVQLGREHLVESLLYFVQALLHMSEICINSLVSRNPCTGLASPRVFSLACSLSSTVCSLLLVVKLQKERC